ncbi:hypothetical protein ABW19_dt0202589 [Dactylella cylindrospora]|nr:hypothetical protein ABW19_dt0202589 [Dactylella cylindrospora]
MYVSMYVCLCSSVGGIVHKSMQHEKKKKGSRGSRPLRDPLFLFLFLMYASKSTLHGQGSFSSFPVCAENKNICDSLLPLPLFADIWSYFFQYNIQVKKNCFLGFA